jgi:[ribosomal protein S5]-alanine N-acetyltransferase
VRFIGDKGVHNLADAERYIRTGPMETKRRFGFALNLVRLKDGAIPIGICGLVKRDQLPHPDLGFALLEAHWRRGYAVEAASAVMEHARTVLRLPRLLAMTTPDNDASARVLHKLGFVFDRLVKFPDDRGEELKLFSCSLEERSTEVRDD